MSPSGIETLVGNFPKQQTFVINSIFDSDLNDFDKNVVFINIRDLESLFNLETNDRYIEVYLKNPSQIEIAKKKLKKIFKNSSVTTWSDFNSSLFMALKVERNVMFIILSLIIFKSSPPKESCIAIKGIEKPNVIITINILKMLLLK